VLVQPTAESREELRGALEASNQIYSHVKMPREGALDASFMHFASKIFSEQAERINSGFRSYDPSSFTREIKRLMASPEGIKSLSARVRAYSLSTERAQFMMGPMDTEIKVRRVRERAQKDVVKEVERPDDVDDLEEDDKNEVTKRVELLAEHLPKAGEQMSYWKYIYDGTEDKGFGRTVENLFYSSFLVRDGLAGLHVVDMQPILTRRDPPAEDDYVERRVHKHQCVVQFDYPMWETLRAKFGSETYLPAPTAVALTAPGSSSQPTQASQAKKAGKKTASTNNIVSPNSKKRGRDSMDPVEEDDDMVSQIAPTPDEELPKAKRARNRN
jgi:hypothetical protein